MTLVLNVEMESRMGDEEICISGFLSAERLPCINVLNVDTLKTRHPNFEGTSNLNFSL